MFVQFWILSMAPSILTSIYRYRCLFKDQLVACRKTSSMGSAYLHFQHTNRRTHISIKNLQIHEHKKIWIIEEIAKRKLCSLGVPRVGSECIFHILLVGVTQEREARHVGKLGSL